MTDLVRADQLDLLDFANWLSDIPARLDLAIEVMARRHVEFTAENIREDFLEPEHPSQLGAAFHRAAKRGLIEPVGVKRAERPSRRASLLPVWKGTGA